MKLKSAAAAAILAIVASFQAVLTQSEHHTPSAGATYSVTAASYFSSTPTAMPWDSQTQMPQARLAASEELCAIENILQCDDLYVSPAFARYVRTATDIFKTHVDPELDASVLLSLATKLGAARSELSASVETLPLWLALERSLRPDAERYVAVPTRFIAPPGDALETEDDTSEMLFRSELMGALDV